MVFHVAVIVTPLFLAAHVALWHRGLGISWPALGAHAADVLTITAIATSLALVLLRLASAAGRKLSRWEDHFFPLWIALCFASGFLAAHPGMNPFSYEFSMFVHAMSGDILMLSVPFTKMSHIAVFPLTQLVSEMGWYLRLGSGRDVMTALGKEGEPV
jgi:nitrate reductase gamma subunit